MYYSLKELQSVAKQNGIKYIQQRKREELCKLLGMGYVPQERKIAKKRADKMANALKDEDKVEMGRKRWARVSGELGSELKS